MNDILEVCWGSEKSNVAKELRGLVRVPGELGRGEIILRASRSNLDREFRWSFEVCGPGMLSARSTYTYGSESEAKEAAEHMAEAVLTCPKGSRR